MTFPKHWSDEQCAKAHRNKKKVGVSRFDAHFFDKLEFSEAVFRTARGSWGYLVAKDTFTWGKRSKKHGDFGFIDKNIQDWDRTRFLLHNDIPMSATKVGAARALLARLRKEGAKYGLDFVEDYEGEEDPEPSIAQKIKRVETWLKRNAK